MSHKVNLPRTFVLDRADSYFDVGRSLRRAFKPALTARPDARVEALMQLLMCTSADEAASRQVA